MIRPRHLLQSLLVASTLGAVAIPAFADAPCGPMGGAGGYREHRAERMEQHHKKVHDALKLTAEQEVAWKKLVDSEHPMHKPEPGKAEDWAKLTTPERADKMLERMKTHEAAMTSHIAVLKEFYAVLTPEQRKIFDDSHRNTRRDGMRGKHMSPPAVAPVKQ